MSESKGEMSYEYLLVQGMSTLFNYYPSLQ